MPKQPNEHDKVEEVVRDMPIPALEEIQKFLVELIESGADGEAPEGGSHIWKYTDKNGVEREFSISVMSGKQLKKELKRKRR